MKRPIILALAAALTACAQQAPEAILTTDWTGTAKLEKTLANPLVDFNFTADPTAVEYEGRLYVYATNDQQQCDEKGPDSDNTYERIKTLAMMSTEDMVNWTWHGIINVEEDGKTHFYLYFSNNGNGFDYSNNHTHLHLHKYKATGTSSTTV